MMYGHYLGMGAGWSMFAVLFVVPLLIVVVVATLLLLRTGTADVPRPDAEKVLADRLVRGEIDVEEYEQRLAALRATGTRSRSA